MSEVSLHNLSVSKGAKRRAKRVGRGNASGHGTYSGRGLKGQRARSGGKGGLKLRGLKQLLRNKPKIGGFKSPHIKPIAVTLTTIEKYFAEGEVVNAKVLAEKKIISTAKYGIKLIGADKMTKKLSVEAIKFSESAKKAIMEAGGKAIDVVKPAKKKGKSKK